MNVFYYNLFCVISHAIYNDCMCTSFFVSLYVDWNICIVDTCTRNSHVPALAQSLKRLCRRCHKSSSFDQCFTSPASSARVLLQTPRKVVNILDIAGRKSNHFGPQKGLRRILRDCEQMPSELRLSLDIDGLPLIIARKGSFGLSLAVHVN